MNSILVTGATGFIGKNLIKSLSQNKKFQTTAIIRYSAELPVKTIIIEPINEKTDWTTHLNNIETVIHLAGRAHILKDKLPDSKKEFFKVNTEGTINIVNQSLKAGVKHFIFISSIGAVATLSTSFLNENTPCFPKTPYGQSKLEAEQGLIQLANNSLMDWTILRPTLVYGSGNPGNMERLFKLIQLGIPLPLDGIKNHRSFLYVENLVNAIITCLTHPKARNQIFHISDGQDLSTSDLIRKIAHHAGYPCRIFYCPLPILHGLGYCGDILELLSNRSLPLNQKTIQKLTHSLRVDSNHIRQTLDWHPPFTVDEGIAQTFSHSSL